MIEPKSTSFLICSYTKSNNGAARGEPVEYMCRRVERSWCAFGSLYTFCEEENEGAVSDLRVTNRGNGTLENELLWKIEKKMWNVQRSTLNVECSKGSVSVDSWCCLLGVSRE